MNWGIPSWYTLILLSLAAYRTWRLLAEDTILDRPRAWLLRKLPKGEEWLTCPWCAGAWVSIGWWLAWQAWPHWTGVVAIPFVISALVGLVGSHLDPD